MEWKPSEREEEYFAVQEFEKRKMLEEERHKELEEEEKRKLKELHYMRCPKCGMKLIQIDYKGIKIDRCSACGGVWLDDGELEVVSKLEKPNLVRFFYIFGK